MVWFHRLSFLPHIQYTLHVSVWWEFLHLLGRFRRLKTSRNPQQCTGHFSNQEEMGGVCSWHPFHQSRGATGSGHLVCLHPSRWQGLFWCHGFFHVFIRSLTQHSFMSGALRKSRGDVNVFSDLQEFTHWGQRLLPL